MENEIIKITTNEEGKQLVSARELHEFLGLQKRFSAWIEQYIKEDNEYMFVDGEDFVGCTQKYTANQHGAVAERQDYAITIQMAKEISMVTKNEKGKQARRYFIQCEKQLKSLSPKDSYMIEDPIERAKRWIEEAEERKRLAERNKELENEVIYKEDVIIGLVKDIDLAEKRQRISQIVRKGHKNYSERYGLLYKEFELTYHIDVDRRLKNAKEDKKIKKSANKMDCICDLLGMTNELYDICCKLFENDFNKLIEEIKTGVC